MEKLTAMQTLIEELRDYKRTTHSDKLVITYWIVVAEKLLEKEREQIDHAFNTGYDCGFYDTNVESDKYYNENYNQ